MNITYVRWGGHRSRALGLWCWESVQWLCFSETSPSAAADWPGACSAESPRWTWRWSPGGALLRGSAAAGGGSVSEFRRRSSLSQVFQKLAHRENHNNSFKQIRPSVSVNYSIMITLPGSTFKIKYTDSFKELTTNPCVLCKEI